ncbi:MAG: 50S ribosomal protein L9 [Chloroflexi bacterium]|nr:50S ribosomal protein L9 [Chloroflexota bacterium]
MEVVFTQDVLNQARAGEIKTVADGFARNYLIPQGLAQVATPEVLKRLHKIKAAGDETRIQETKSMEELASALDDTTVTITARVTPTGRYYGAITSTRIASEIASAVGREIDRRLLDSAETIREPGEYDMVLRFSSEIQATIHVAAEIEE